MAKALIIKGADFSKNCISSAEINPGEGFKDLTLLMNYYQDDSGNAVKQTGSTASNVFGAIVNQYFSVNGGQTIKIRASGFSVVRICEYNSSKEFIQRQIVQAFSGEHDFTMDSTTSYIMLSISKNDFEGEKSYEAFMELFNRAVYIDYNQLIAISYTTVPE